MKKQFSIRERGFTLIELLTVTVVTVTVSVIIVIVLAFALRGTDKANSLNDVRGSGNSTILQISKMIGYAKSFDGVSIDGINYASNCLDLPTPPPEPTKYSFVKITNFDGSKTVFSCLNGAGSPTIASNGASLIDTNSVSLEASSCYFTCTQVRITNVPTIGINFSLRKKSGSAFIENKTTVPFQTSVTMRNLGK